MHVIYVDADESALNHFRQTVKDYREITSLQLFSAAGDAVKWMENHPVDVAFLDTEIGGVQGPELARQLKEIDKNIRIVFVTAHTQYALEAFGVDAIGYVLKPYSGEHIKNELEKASRIRPVQRKKVEITTFPAFHVKVNGDVLRLSNAKSIELLALFVERRGVGITGGEAISYLWPERSNDSSTQTLYRMTLKRLMDALRKAGVEDMIGRAGRMKYLRTEKVDCDFYKVLDGDKEAAKYYTGEFMQEYSWAEVRNAQLYSIAKK